MSSQPDSLAKIAFEEKAKEQGLDLTRSTKKDDLGFYTNEETYRQWVEWLCAWLRDNKPLWKSL